MTHIVKSKPDLNSLIHYGVNGMHWGVRRQLKREGRRRMMLVGNEMRSRLGYASREISESEYRTMSSAPIKLGKDFGRIANKTDLRDIVYVTNNAKDHTRYTALFGPEGSLKNLKDERLDLKIKTKKEVISPGMKERVDTYIDTLGSQIKTADGKTNTGKEHLFGVGNKAAEALNNREIGLSTYQIFAQSQHMNTPVHSAYFEKLRKKGYTAVIDDADREFMAKTPVILFPKDSGARVIEVKPITKDDHLKAKATIELLN